MRLCSISPQAIRDLDEISTYEDLNPELRGVPLEGYIILYHVTEAELTVLRVVSGRQNLANLFGDSQSDDDPI